jgi:adenine deaminase
MILQRNVIDIHNREIYPAEVMIQNHKILSINRLAETKNNTFLLPGFIDSHIHIESSMLVPSEFARMAVKHGTVATISDPHEIANVLGLKGVNYMINNANRVPFKFFFGAPSCVPATSFESAGDRLDSKEIEELLKQNDIWYLSEMMNFPGVIHGEEEVLKKISLAIESNKPIDGHAPGLTGELAAKYFRAGISTDHECFSLDEARYKAKLGVKILIREGSAAKNFEALHPLIKEYPELVMFCSDDKHPDDLLIGHIDLLVKRALQLGYDKYDILRAACLHPIEHYKVPVGSLRVGDPADFIEIDNLENLAVLATYIDGECVYNLNKVHILSQPIEIENQFNLTDTNRIDIKVPVGGDLIKVIQVRDKQLITDFFQTNPLTKDGLVISDTQRDILKIVVLNRYSSQPASVGFIHGFGIKSGALASTIAHDSHNIIALGVSDDDILNAINSLIQCKGGISFSSGEGIKILPLPIAGLMSPNTCEEVAEAYAEISSSVLQAGCTLTSPFMSLSFMALLVIPDLKISDKGLFDGSQFKFTPLFTS